MVFIESVMAVTLVMVVLAAIAQLVVLSARQRRESAQRQIASQELANLLDRMYATSWSELSDESLSSTQIDPDVADQFDEPMLAVSIEAVEDLVPTKAIRVRLSWLNRAGVRIEPVELTAWKHRPEGAP